MPRDIDAPGGGTTDLLLPSHILAFVVIQKIEPGAAEMNVVFGDLVAQQAARPRVVLPGTVRRRKIAQPRSR
jgi:hypothetical protein